MLDLLPFFSCTSFPFQHSVPLVHPSRMMEGHLDIIEEVMKQPPSDDQRTMVNEMFRECAEHRMEQRQKPIVMKETRLWY